MVVFYINNYDGTRQYQFIKYVGHIITEFDISYWRIPGTFDMEDE